MLPPNVRQGEVNHFVDEHPVFAQFGFGNRSSNRDVDSPCLAERESVPDTGALLQLYIYVRLGAGKTAVVPGNDVPGADRPGA